jgi:hypothetical protein
MRILAVAAFATPAEKIRGADAELAKTVLREISISPPDLFIGRPRPALSLYRFSIAFTTFLTDYQTNKTGKRKMGWGSPQK